MLVDSKKQQLSFIFIQMAIVTYENVHWSPPQSRNPYNSLTYHVGASFVLIFDLDRHS